MTLEEARVVANALSHAWQDTEAEAVVGPLNEQLEGVVFTIVKDRDGWPVCFEVYPDY